MNRFLLAFAAVLALAACGTPNTTTPGPDASVEPGPDAAAQPVPVTCAIVSPAADALLTASVDVKVEFQGPATKVEILDGDAVVASADVAASPATVALDTTKLSEGAHTLKARASSAEASGESAAVAVVTDNKAPVIGMALPHLTMLSGADAAIHVVVTEPHVAKCQLVEGETVLVDLAAAPSDIVWDTTKVSDGLHTVKVQVTDTVGHVGATAEQTIIVANHALMPLPAITYIPAATVEIPEGYQPGDEIDVRGMIENPGQIKRIVTWLTWDPKATPTPMNLEYSVGQGLCPHRGIKFVGKESTEGEIVLEFRRSDFTYTDAQETNGFPWKADPTTFPDNDDPETAGSFFGHIAVMDALDHLKESLPVKMTFVLFTE